MARWYWLFRQTQARYPTIESAVRTQIIEAAEENGVAVDGETLTGYHAKPVFDVEYEWEITSAADAYIVREKQYITALWYIVFGLALVLFAGIVIDGITAAEVFPGDGIAAFVVVIVFGLLVYPFFYETPVKATMGTNEDYRSHPAAGVILLLTGPLVLVTVLFGWLTFTVQPHFWAVTVLFVISTGLVVVVFRRQTSLRQFDPGQIPHIYELLSGYLFTILFGLIPASALIGLQPVLLPTLSIHPVFLLLIVIVEVTILAILVYILSRDRTFSYHRLRKGEETVQQPAYRPPLLLLLGVAAYAMVMIGVYVLVQYGGLLSLTRPVISTVVVLALVPVLYIPGGVLFQTVTSVREMYRLFRNAEPITLETPSDFTPRIRRIDADGYIAGSYSLGFRSYIFVSEGVLTDLDSEELDAIVAHEEGHLYHRDALLSFLVPLAALVLVAGKNVMYTVLDFRTREFRADAYAVEQVGEEPLRQALQTMAAKTDNTAEAWITGSAPTFNPLSRQGPPSVVDRYFGTYFGNFALTEAHPGVDERIQRLGN